MPLEEYAAKRQFREHSRTASSGREAAALPAKPYFCVQRHDATRLHYDFRLEIDGVLKSWAVPKGPTLDPAREAFRRPRGRSPPRVRRFRRQHSGRQLRRGQRHAVGPRHVRTAGRRRRPRSRLARGDLKFRLHGEKLKGDFALVHMKGRGKGNEWLLIKKRDAVRRARLGRGGATPTACSPAARRRRSRATCRRARPSARPPAPPTASGPAAVRPNARAPAAHARRSRQARAAPKKKPKFDLASLQGRARRPTCPTAIEPMKATLAEQPPARRRVALRSQVGRRARHRLHRSTKRSACNRAAAMRCERQYPELA